MKKESQHRTRLSVSFGLYPFLEFAGFFPEIIFGDRSQTIDVAVRRLSSYQILLLAGVRYILSRTYAAHTHTHTHTPGLPRMLPYITVVMKPQQITETPIRPNHNKPTACGPQFDPARITHRVARGSGGYVSA